MNSGVHASLHLNCHHQIVHTSFNLDISYPRPIWDYKKADFEKIKKALDLVNWERLFSKKDINTQVSILNETILNVLRMLNESKSNAKHFANDTSLFTIVKDKNKSANMLNYDLRRISKWAYNCKMLFNPDPSNPAQEVVFSKKKKLQSHPTISLNIQVERASYFKHLGILLDEKLNFKQHIDSVILEMNKGISVLKKLRYSLPRKSLLTIYKAFLRPLVDYGDINYDQPQNESFCNK